MRSFSKVHLSERLRSLRTGLQHAFSTRDDSAPLSEQDVELMTRVASMIVKRGMAVPATVFLESVGPMSFLGSQALHFLKPIIDVAFDAREVEQIARLLERRDSVPRLLALIEAASQSERTSAQ